tara:strand:+ start:194 stop:1810 length:1617 start_codon:yes stop_codon:yes gene_type:complete
MNQFKRIYLNLIKFNQLSKVVMVKKKKLKIFFSIFAKNVNAGVEVVIVVLISYALTNEQPSNQFIENLQFDKLVILIPFLVLVRLGINYLDHLNQEKLIIDTTQSLKKDASQRLFSNENLSFAYINYKVSAESQSIASVYKTFISLIGTVFQLLIYFLSLVFLNINVALILIFIGIVLLKPILLIMKKFKENSEKNRALTIELDRTLERILNNFYLIKILKKEKSEINRFNEGVDLLANVNFTNTKLFFVTHNLFNTTVTLIISILIVQSIINIKLTLEVIFILLRGVQYISQISGMYGNLLSQGIYVNSYLDGLKNASPEKLGIVEFIESKDSDENSILFNNISFKYADTDENIFEEISISISKNSHTLITGPNGSGKSTLIGLMNGIYKPNNGEIKIFSDKFSYVGPVPLIFLDTLRNNLLYGVEETIEDSLLVNWINKYNIFDSFRESDLENTISSESLSSGQMQKISIIRALLRSPEILFLDEATSNLDSKTVKLVGKEIEDFKGTIINITHKPEHFSNAEKTYLIDNKNLIEI